MDHTAHAAEEKGQAVSLIEDPEFRQLIPPVTKEEFEELERSILEDGCRDAIVIWKRHGIIIDGHARYGICRTHGIPFDTRELPFENRDDAKEWIIRNQIGRRNISTFTRAELVSALKGLIAEKAKQNMRLGRGNKTETVCHTRDELAQQAGVGHNMISLVQKVKQKGTPGLVDAARRADLSPAAAAEICQLDEAEQDRLLAELPKGEKAVIIEMKAYKKEKEREARQAKLNAQRNTGTSQGIGCKANVFDWLPTIPDGSVDLLLTDPPYSTHIKNIEAFAASWLPLALSKVKDTGRCYIFVGAYPREIAAYENVLAQYDTFERSLLAWSYRNTIGRKSLKDYVLNFQMIFHVWGKNAPDLNAPDLIEQFSHHEINAPDARTGVRYHEWEKPHEIGDMFVRHGSKEGDLVIDPFMGTGTFIVAAANLNRVARGCDTDDEALDNAKAKGCLII
jgi:hypothetical protein